MSRRKQEYVGASRSYGRLVGCAIISVGLIVMVGVQNGFAIAPGDRAAHFDAIPPLAGTPADCNAAVRGWLLTGARNIVTDMQKMVDDSDLSNQSVLSFQQRIRADFTIEIPVTVAVTNTERIIKEFEKEVRASSTAEELRLSQDNLKNAKAQLAMLLFNRECVAVLRNKLTEFDQASVRWADRWERALHAVGVQEARKQLQLLIDEKRADFLQWLGTAPMINVPAPSTHQSSVVMVPVPTYGPLPIQEPAIRVQNAPVAEAAGATNDLFVVNIPNAKGTYTPIALKRSGTGFVGPQGEFYAEFPRVKQLVLMYGN